MRANLFLSLVMVFLGVSLSAQDILLMKSGEEIICWINQVTENEVKYEVTGYSGGQERTVSKSLVSAIRYDSGKVEVFSGGQPTFKTLPSGAATTELSLSRTEQPARQQTTSAPGFPTTTNEPAQQEQSYYQKPVQQQTARQEPVQEEEQGYYQKPVQEEEQGYYQKHVRSDDPFEEEDGTGESKSKSSDYKGNYFLMGLGVGYSYGGYGFMAGARFGRNVGFGFHGGVGYFPNAPVLASGGIKFYPFRGIFIDWQYGLVGYEQGYRYDYYYSTYSGSSYSYDEYEFLLHGASMLVGCEWTWGGKVGFGFHASAGISYYVNGSLLQGFNIAYDLGYVMRF